MKYLAVFLFVIVFLFLPFNNAFAHNDPEQEVDGYNISTTQDPLSPLVGESVKVSFTIENGNEIPVAGLSGNLIVKEYTVDKFTGDEKESDIKEIYRTKGTTDNDGTVSLEYTFNKEAYYDVEFSWGNGDEQNIGKIISVREPTSYFAKDELIKKMGLFTIITFVGIVIGAFGTFGLMTMSLNPRKRK